MRRLLPSSDHVPTELDDAQLAEVYGYPDARSWLRANFIATVDGAAQGPDHRSGSISGRADRRMLALLRALADVILVGAGTARAEGYGPATIRPEHAPLREGLGMPPTPPIAVLTRSLDVPEDLLHDPRTIVLTCASAPAWRRAELSERVEVRVAGEDRVDVRRARATLVELGHRRLLCEGGPSLLAELVRAGVLDELCHTTAPLLAPGAALRLTHAADPESSEPARLELAGLLEDGGFLFARWLQQNPPS